MILRQSWLTRNVRIAIMCSLITLFFIISPIVIFYTAGYRYDLSSHRILQTGVISVDVLPKSTVTTLNNITIDKRTPLRLTNRAPGSYQIALAAEGYYDWNKVITVGSKQTTYISDVKLLKQSIPERVDAISLVPSSILYAASTKPFFLRHSTEKTLHELTLIDANRSIETSIARLQATELIDVTFATDESAVAFVFATISGYEVVFIELAEVATSYRAQTTIQPKLFFRGDTLIIAEGNVWTSLDPSNGLQAYSNTTSTILLPNNDAGTWYTKNTQDNFMTLTNQSAKETIRLNTRIDDIVWNTENVLVASRGTDILVFERRDTQANLVETIEQGTVFQQDTHVIIWSPTTIFKIESNGNRSLLLRTSNALSHVALTNREKSEFILSSDDTIIHFDPDYNLSTVLQSDVSGNAISTSDGTALLFSATVGQQSGMFQLDI
jgi:hypothetical protein